MENSWIFLVSTFAVALLISILFLKRFIVFSKKKMWLDLPNDRKQHLNPTPSSGGIIFGVLILLLLPFIVLYTTYSIVILSALLLLVVGFYDDCHDLSAKLKFAFQAFAAIVALIAIGPLNLIPNNPLFLNEILSFLFILGFTNSFNLIDGVDGLAGSYAVVVLLIITTVLLLNYNFSAAIITITILSGLIGFLKFNWNPAKIFMGDTGSLFLGFFISIFAIVAINTQALTHAWSLELSDLQLFLISAFILPMMDTVRVMYARIVRRKSPFKADRSHLHHLLMKIGLSTKMVPFFFIFATVLLLSLSTILIQLEYDFIFVLLSLIASVIILFCAILVIRIQQHKIRMRRYQNSLNHIIKKNQLMHYPSIHLLKNR